MSDRWADLSGPEREAWLRGGKLYEVLDSYGIPVFTGTLNECGVWIDPVLGIDFDGSVWGTERQVTCTGCLGKGYNTVNDRRVTCTGCKGKGSHTVRRRNIDADRFEIQDDGTIVVQMYQGPGGIGGEMTIRPKEDA